jgi:hypothetical protein
MMFGAHKTCRTLVRTLQGLLAALLISLALPAAAQPSIGSVHRSFLALGSGSSVALPDGNWEVTVNSAYTSGGGTPWLVYVLKNQTPDSAIPYLVVRQSTGTGRWGATACQNAGGSHFLKSEHGTGSNDPLNKCSRFFSIGDIKSFAESLSQHPDAGTRAWWQEAAPGLQDLRQRPGVSMLLAEFRVQLFNQRAIQIEALIYPPRGVRAAQFRQRFLDGRPDPEHDILGNWASIYIESLQQTFFEKKPQPVMTVAYTPNFQRGGGGNTFAAAPAATEPARVAPPAIPAAPGVATAPLPAPDTSAERQRLETERRALEQERQQVAQQLDVMRQMLAKLQQENAAVTAARAQESQTRATPTPAAPVVYANRKALVIGNDQYTHVSKLNNAAADAEAMAKSLEAVGYRVTKHVNLDERRFKQVLRDFRQNVQGGDEVLFFFAGHGVQLGNANYLLPIDIRSDGEDQVKDESILLQRILDEFDEKKAKFTLAVIDACRDNPFKTRGRAIGGRGLAPTSAATGQMVMFSAGAGQQALDRLGDQDKERNGLFTRVFVKEMQKPGLSVDRVLRNVRNEVVRLAKTVGHEQTPALYDQAIGEFYFKR